MKIMESPLLKYLTPSKHKIKEVEYHDYILDWYNKVGFNPNPNYRDLIPIGRLAAALPQIKSESDKSLPPPQPPVKKHVFKEEDFVPITKENLEKQMSQLHPPAPTPPPVSIPPNYKDVGPISENLEKYMYENEKQKQKPKPFVLPKRTYHYGQEKTPSLPLPPPSPGSLPVKKYISQQPKPFVLPKKTYYYEGQPPVEPPPVEPSPFELPPLKPPPETIKIGKMQLDKLTTKDFLGFIGVNSKDDLDSLTRKYLRKAYDYYVNINSIGLLGNLLLADEQPTLNNLETYENEIVKHQPKRLFNIARSLIDADTLDKKGYKNLDPQARLKVISEVMRSMRNDSKYIVPPKVYAKKRSPKKLTEPQVNYGQEIIDLVTPQPTPSEIVSNVGDLTPLPEPPPEAKKFTEDELYLLDKIKEYLDTLHGNVTPKGKIVKRKSISGKEFFTVNDLPSYSKQMEKIETSLEAPSRPETKVTTTRRGSKTMKPQNLSRTQSKSEKTKLLPKAAKTKSVIKNQK
jgi:hypothetical protein